MTDVERTIRMYTGETEDERKPQLDFEHQLMALTMRIGGRANGVDGPTMFAAFVNLAMDCLHASPEPALGRMLEGFVIAMGNNFGSVTRVDAPDDLSATKH